CAARQPSSATVRHDTSCDGRPASSPLGRDEPAGESGESLEPSLASGGHAPGRGASRPLPDANQADSSSENMGSSTVISFDEVGDPPAGVSAPAGGHVAGRGAGGGGGDADG